MRISDWSSDVCSSDLLAQEILEHRLVELARHAGKGGQVGDAAVDQPLADAETQLGRELVEGRSFDELIEYLIEPARFDEGGHRQPGLVLPRLIKGLTDAVAQFADTDIRSEEQTAELQSLMTNPDA